MKTENKIVEYVECIKGDGNESYNIVGNIYKVKDYNPRTGELYLYILNISISNIFFEEESMVKYNNTDYKISTKEAFENHILKQQEMKTITYNQAQQIIDIACPTWKEKLFTLWGKSIVLKQEITISGESYKEMRNACTEEQNKLFDEMFGKDVYSFKVGEYVVPLFESGRNRYHKRKTNTAYKINKITDKCVKVFNEKGEDDGNGFINFEDARHATEEEIQKANYIPKGTPCLVRDFDLQNWMLAYSKGDGRSKMADGNIVKWKYVRVLDINNLPTY